MCRWGWVGGGLPPGFARGPPDTHLDVVCLLVPVRPSASHGGTCLAVACMNVVPAAQNFALQTARADAG